MLRSVHTGTPVLLFARVICSFHTTPVAVTATGYAAQSNFPHAPNNNDQTRTNPNTPEQNTGHHDI